MAVKSRCFSCAGSFPASISADLLRYKAQYDLDKKQMIYYKTSENDTVNIIDAKSFFAHIKPVFFKKGTTKKGANWELIQGFTETTDSEILGNSKK